ncbi:MAG: class I SAM-dependent methyltransferase [Planctomycetota bacterium]|jgi:tRNA (mo5U34)-methyltransferase
MTTTQSDIVPADLLRQEIRTRRIWYHDIEWGGQIRTRFEEDYQANPVLKAVDQGNARVREWLTDGARAQIAGGTVLDLGCADGGFSFWAAAQGARRVTGIERNRYNCDRATWLKEKLSLDQVDFRCGSLERHCQDLADDSFDVILCIALLYHLIDPLGTLHRLHRLCSGKMAIVTAVDLPEGDGTPLARLDRYATGAHGFWSHNVPMIRQMLSMVGFNIESEKIERRGGGDRYSVIAVPSGVAQHHVFDHEIDQPFPVNLEARRHAARRRWHELADSGAGRVAIFGAGVHTPWLLDAVRDIQGVAVACVMDDRIMPSELVAGLPVKRPTDMSPDDLDAIVISSWHQGPTLVKRAREVFGPGMKLITID